MVLILQLGEIIVYRILKSCVWVRNLANNIVVSSFIRDNLTRESNINFLKYCMYHRFIKIGKIHNEFDVLDSEIEQHIC